MGKGVQKCHMNPFKFQLGTDLDASHVFMQILYNDFIIRISTVLYNTCRHNEKCLEDLSIWHGWAMVGATILSVQSPMQMP